MWCLAHRLELAIKDALTGTVFDHVDDMLTCLFYLYSKSPKKCREIQDIITDLKQCLTFDDNGIKPKRASYGVYVQPEVWPSSVPVNRLLRDVVKGVFPKLISVNLS